MRQNLEELLELQRKTTALKSRIKTPCDASLEQTCETLSLPSECTNAPEAAKFRANRLKGALT